MLSVLLIDDEQEILDINRKYLEKKGLQIECAKNKLELVNQLSKHTFDCIVLDIILEDTNGFILCDLIKKMCDTPIIFLTNLVNVESQIQGFLHGADDYMTKPYDLRLLWLRIKACIKTKDEKLIYNSLDFPPLYINLDTRQVSINETSVFLTVLEFDILVLLSSNEKTVFSLSEIYCRIWGQDDAKRPSTAQVHISNLRHKLIAVYPEHNFIQTSWGRGYYFNSTY